MPLVVGPLGLWGQAVAALAQQDASVPANPHEIERRIEERGLRRPPAEPEVEVAPEPAGAPGEALSFVLSAVVPEGASVFGPGDFAPLYEEYLARTITAAEVEAIVSRVTGLYRDNGYFLSRAIAPPQDLVAGVLHIRVIEGYIDAVSFAGESPGGASLDAYAADLIAERPATLARFERTVLLINDLPGVSAGARIVPVAELAGAYRLEIELAYRPVDVEGYVDNRGTRSVGRLEALVSGGLNSVLGYNERLQARAFFVPNQPRELLYYEASYAQPLGHHGTTVSVTGAASDSNAGEPLTPFDIESGSTFFVAQAWHPLIRSRAQSLWLLASFELLDLEETQHNVTSFKDRLRVARIGANYLFGDGLDGTNWISLQASKGVQAFGATDRNAPAPSRADGRSDFEKVTAEVTRDQPLFSDFALQLTARAQKSFVPLLTTEEFALGGGRYGRGYDYSELKGDDGVAAAAELRYTGTLDQGLLDAVQTYLFYDVGAVWNAVPGGGSDRESLASAGGGVRLTLASNLLATIEVAKPLTRIVANEGDRDPRVFFSVSAAF